MFYHLKLTLLYIFKQLKTTDAFIADAYQNNTQRVVGYTLPAIIDTDDCEEFHGIVMSNGTVTRKKASAVLYQQVDP